ncbi:MAG: hypothetical protein CBB68_11600 [Rhodospirillaceae bacterium TMED8]|nr:hypothetical protein [Magnetovibrio sp.]OUT49637.1 MAG: hypothetical protein CBB68_11600 [Rhodospirillaceae bacterium TMED8]|tara:strand:- start:533 stop:961 length:429 start_codon:yes stop_codon:yes gene_type:complete
MLKYILYTSKVARECGDREIKDILRVSRANNARNSVTGMLIYKDDDFLQYLEGPSEHVTELYEVIEKDQRHQDVNVVKDGMIEERVFYDWDMGFADQKSMRPLQWKWQIDKLSLLALAEDASECLSFVTEFLQTPAVENNVP